MTMVDFEQLLLAEQKNPNATVLEFINSEYEADNIIVFVEGIFDPHFYYDFLSGYFPQREIRFFACGGKRALGQVKQFLAGYPLAKQPERIFYLADRDFGAIAGVPQDDIFRTRFYSIESYFSHYTYVDYLLSKFLPTQIKGATRSKIVSAVEKDMVALSNLLIAPMSFLCHIRSLNVAANFDKISIRHLLDVANINKTPNKTIRRLDKIAAELGLVLSELPKICLMTYARSMRRLEYRYWLRGKIALQLVKICVRRAAVNLNAAAQNALNSVMPYIGATALMQSHSFLKQLPELEAYVAAA